jgi:DNA mismatch endonuclease (patch repair protein)
MSRIRGRDTQPEMTVRSRLHKLGYRFRLHVGKLPGTPDLVFVSRRKLLFVHGCYWHGHSCRWGAAQSKSNVKFWRAKLKVNRRRDARVMRYLRRNGWKALVIWECQIKSDSWLRRTRSFLGDPGPPNDAARA